ncbi:cache domain-containing protein [Desulfoluna sp.]|uniref:cache domain-containing protein n=1 Tax=Desulfoluna sp. TaxID=2045199 RepID=UPI002626D94C|nr:cache domain-containing protein [Desulfoluna sp.]
MKKRWTISGTYFSFMMLLMVCTLTGLGGLWVAEELNQYKKDSHQIRSQFMASRRTTLVHLTDQIETSLQRDIALAERIFKQQLKERVLEAASLLLAIHSENQTGLPLETRHALMKNALRNTRYSEHRRFFFALSADGALLFNSIRPELDGTPFDHLAHQEEFPIARQIVDLAMNHGEGYLTYRYPKPTQAQGPLYPKTSYIRLIKPLGWIVGTGYYHDDFYQRLQKRLIQELHPLINTNGDRIFIFSDKGKLLIGPSCPEMDAASLSISGPGKAGQFIDYASPLKGTPFLAYMRPFPQWGWTIVASADTLAMDRAILRKQEALKKRIRDHLLYVLLILCTAITITALASGLFARHLARSFAFFSAFFKKASLDFTTIDPAKLFFSEFKSLADAANRMILKRKLTETALRENEEKYKALVDNTLQGVIIIQNRCIVFANAACTTISGLPHEDIIHAEDETLRQWTHPDDIDPVWACFETVFENPDSPPMTWTYRVIKGCGAIAWVEITVSHLWYLGHPAALCTLSDITRRKASEIELAGYREQLEEKVAEKTRELTEAKNLAETALEVKSRFLANISHEIKTPMNAIMGVAELLEAEGLTDKQQNYIDIMGRSSRALLTLINDILDFSRAKSGKITPEMISFNYLELMEEVADIFTPQAEEKGLALVIDIDPELPPAITGDPLRIRQVLVNLTANAIKFTHSGSVTLACRVVKKRDQTITFQTLTQDTGIGIDFKKLPHGDARSLFEPFSQADSSTTRKYGGTGLGLAICQNIIALLGGELTVQSSLGQGSLFSFHLTTPWDTSKRRPRLNITGSAVLVGPPCPEETTIRQTLQWFGFTVERIPEEAWTPSAPARWTLAFWLLPRDEMDVPGQPIIPDWPKGLKKTFAVCPGPLFDTTRSLLKDHADLVLLKTPLKPSQLNRRLSEVQTCLVQEETPPQESGQKIPAPSSAALTELAQTLALLREKLSENKFDTDLEIEQLKAVLPPEAEALIEDLAYNIENFNYYSALVTLKKITASCTGCSPLSTDN